MDPQEVAILVEFSEARAYRSLVGAAALPALQEQRFRAVDFGSALAIVAPTVTTSLNMNRVIGLGVVEPASEALVDSIVALYGQHELSFGIEVAPAAAPPELTPWLRSRRLRRSGMTALHYRAAERVVAQPSGITVVRAQGAECERVADICSSVFRMPAPVRAVIAATAHVPEWRQWLVYLDSTPIAAALSFVHGGVAWVGWDATLPEHRGHGAQMALIAHRMNDAVDCGCRHVTTETAVHSAVRPDPSYRNYQKAGFRFAYERATYVAMRSARAHPGAGA